MKNKITWFFLLVLLACPALQLIPDDKLSGKKLLGQWKLDTYREQKNTGWGWVSFYENNTCVFDTRFDTMLRLNYMVKGQRIFFEGSGKKFSTKANIQGQILTIDSFPNASPQVIYQKQLRK